MANLTFNLRKKKEENSKGKENENLIDRRKIKLNEMHIQSFILLFCPDTTMCKCPSIKSAIILKAIGFSFSHSFNLETLWNTVTKILE